jgi:poly-beta-hydroxyalkanoate depolymerase
MTYLIHPQDLVFRAKAHILGFNEMIGNEQIPQWDLLETATEVAEEWTNDWDEDQGFGSSDGTFMLKDFIDNVIHQFTSLNIYKTEFNPSLQIVKL